ncbi:MAG: hydrogenase [Candidatus Glassbacteria bacterium]|nr:hydrogenase [Candidatus Glassbacteria bacterium]
MAEIRENDVVETKELASRPWVDEQVTAADVTHDVMRPMGELPGKLWIMGLLLAMGCLALMFGAIGYQLKEGIGILGINNPVGWGVYITNFVFWIGIGHAGTLISAVLLLFRQRWRNSINRTAEAMTIFAVICAGIFPLIHTGRPWLAFWLVPYPNSRLLWVNFRSPLIWDVFAVSTYLTISLLFWYQGLLPDMATVRDAAKNKIKKFVFGILSLGWRPTASHWEHYEKAYWQFAWLATPLVLSVHSIVSFDFAVSLIPGWHATIFPPYFVAGAIFSGMAMVVTLLVIMRKAYGLERYITINHLELMNKVILLTSLMVGYSYAMEVFTAWYSEETYEQFVFMNRLTGPYAPTILIMLICNIVIPQLFWSKRARRSLPLMFVVAIAVNVGMWFERFNIIVTSLHRDFLPASWDMYVPTFWDWAVTVGSFGLFFTLFLLFIKFFPTISIAETKVILAKPFRRAGGEGA